MSKHLWETDHPYYMTEGNYCSNDCHIRFATWAAFKAEWADADPDYNWLVRWDWLEGEDNGASEYTGDEYYRNGVFKAQFILQRKAILISAEAAVCRADEPAVRKFLQSRWDYMRDMWVPFSGALPA